MGIDDGCDVGAKDGTNDGSNVGNPVGICDGRSDGTPVGSSVGTDVGTQVYIDGSVSQHGVPRSLSVAMLQPVTPESESAATSVGISPQRALLYRVNPRVIASMLPNCVGITPVMLLP